MINGSGPLTNGSAAARLPAAASQPAEEIRVDVRVEHPLVRAGLCAALKPCKDILLVESGMSARLGGPQQLGVDVTVAQVSPRLLSFLSARAGGGRALAPTVIGVASRSAEAAILDAIRVGVRGFVSEWAAETELPIAVRSIAAGGAFLSAHCAGGLFDWLASQLPADLIRFQRAAAALSEREREVLQHLGKGSSNAQIARALVITETTVRSHVYHILTKLSLRTRTEAVLFGYQFRLGVAGHMPPGGR